MTSTQDLIQDPQRLAAIIGSEQRFAALFEQITAGVAEIDGHGRFVLVNQRYCEMLGYTRDELLSMRMQDVSHPDDLPRNLPLLADLLAGGPPYIIEKRYRRKDGSLLWVNNSVAAIRDAQGRPRHACAVCVDITDRKRAEDAVRQSEERYRSLVTATAQVVWSTAAGGEVVEDLPSWRRFTGQTVEQLKGFGWTAAVHPDDLPRVFAKWEVARRTSRTPHEDEFRLRAADGTWRQVFSRAVPVREADGSVREWIGTLTDITEHRRGEAALQRSENRFRKLVEQSPLSTQIYAPDGTPLQCNAAWERLFGVTLADIPDYNIRRDPELEKHGMADLVRRGFAGEVVVVPPIPYVPDRGAYRGQERWTGATIYPVKSADGVVQEVVLVHEDLTDRKRAEAELHRAKEAAEAANKAKDQFLAVLSHELRTPLTPVLAIVSALEQQADLPRDVRADLEVVRRNVELETRLIDDLLDLTRVTKGKLQLDVEPVDVREAINRVVEICRDDIADKQLLTMIDLPPRDCFARADSARLQQVLWNLLKNAIKFTPVGGRITVRAARDEIAVRVQVIDSGIGIDPAAIPRLFHAFEQGHGASHRFGGLGLGLSISRALAELHGGTLEAHSDGRDRGATFTLTIPAAAAAVRPSDVIAPAPAGAPPAAPHVPAAPRRILLVEDHTDTAQIMIRLLQGENYFVEWAATVADALHAASVQPFDLLVSDLGLPDGSGLELMRRLREAYNLKGIALSGYGMEEDLEKSRAAGFAEHLTKPINLQSLKRVIEALCAAPAPEISDEPVNSAHEKGREVSQEGGDLQRGDSRPVW